MTKLPLPPQNRVIVDCKHCNAKMDVVLPSMSDDFSYMTYISDFSVTCPTCKVTLTVEGSNTYGMVEN